MCVQTDGQTDRRAGKSPSRAPWGHCTQSEAFVSGIEWAWGPRASGSGAGGRPAELLITYGAGDEQSRLLRLPLGDVAALFATSELPAPRGALAVLRGAASEAVEGLAEG